MVIIVWGKIHNVTILFMKADTCNVRKNRHLTIEVVQPRRLWNKTCAHELCSQPNVTYL